MECQCLRLLISWQHKSIIAVGTFNRIHNSFLDFQWLHSLKASAYKPFISAPKASATVCMMLRVSTSKLLHLNILLLWTHTSNRHRLTCLPPPGHLTLMILVALCSGTHSYSLWIWNTWKSHYSCLTMCHKCALMIIRASSNFLKKLFASGLRKLFCRNWIYCIT